MLTFHDPNHATDTRNKGIHRLLGQSSRKLGISETVGDSDAERESRFSRMTRTFLKRRLPTEKPSHHLAAVLGLSPTRASEKLAGSAPFTLRDVLRLIAHFPDFCRGVLERMADSGFRPRFRRRREV